MSVSYPSTIASSQTCCPQKLTLHNRRPFFCKLLTVFSNVASILILPTANVHTIGGLPCPIGRAHPLHAVQTAASLPGNNLEPQHPITRTDRFQYNTALFKCFLQSSCPSSHAIGHHVLTTCQHIINPPHIPNSPPPAVPRGSCAHPTQHWALLQSCDKHKRATFSSAHAILAT